MIPRLALFAALLALLAASSQAFVRNAFRPGRPLLRADAENIQYRVSATTVPGLRNRDDQLTITAGSHPVEALQAALRSWSRIPHSRIRFAPLLASPLESHSRDQTPLVTFADTPANRSLANGAVAVTLLRTNERGRLADTDIVFNPELTFSTNLAEGTFDIRSAFTHELGHALGLDHTGVITASLFATAARQSDTLAVLTGDEAAFAREAYPEGNPGIDGTLEGRVVFSSGEAVNRAHVTAVDPEANVTVGALTGAEGFYRIERLPAGDYVVFAEPLDGPARPEQFSTIGSGSVDSAFPTAFLGGAALPRRVIVTPAGSAVADITVERGAPTLNISGGGAAAPSEDITSFAGALVEQGTVYTMAVFGENLDDPDITGASLSFLANGVGIVPGFFGRGTVRIQDDTLPLLHFRIRVAPDAPPGLATLVLSAAGETVALTGGLKIVESVPEPAFLSEQVVSGASFAAGPLAPGEIFTIFGRNLGPEQSAFGFLNPVSGRLAFETAEVSVTAGGAPAPLFFVSEGQINAQAPVEIVPGEPVDVVVRYQRSESPPVQVPTARTAPGVFMLPGGAQAVALNEDSSVVQPGAPARRGRFLQIFGTGQGEVDPPLAAGDLAGGAGRLSRTVLPVRVEIGGRNAPVSFSGMAPGFAGLWQVNARIPEDAPAGDSVPLRVIIGGAASPTTFIPVR